MHHLLLLSSELRTHAGQVFLEAVKRFKVPLLILVGQVATAELAHNFVRTLSRIEAFLDGRSPPFIAKVYRAAPADAERNRALGHAFHGLERHSDRRMNQALHRLPAEVDLASDANERIRLQFGLACVERVKHFIEDAYALAGC